MYINFIELVKIHQLSVSSVTYRKFKINSAHPYYNKIFNTIKTYLYILIWKNCLYTEI